MKKIVLLLATLTMFVGTGAVAVNAKVNTAEKSVIRTSTLDEFSVYAAKVKTSRAKVYEGKTLDSKVIAELPVGTQVSVYVLGNSFPSKPGEILPTTTASKFKPISELEDNLVRVFYKGKDCYMNLSDLTVDKSKVLEIA